MSQIARILGVDALRETLKASNNKIKLVDCTYAVGPKPDHRTFRDQHYGKFEQLVQRPSNQKLKYLESHLPSAVHFDPDVGLYPGRYERYAMYDPATFQRYAQMLGICNHHHLVFYGRGPFGGMLFASRCYWLFKGYGHKSMSLLNGGYDEWKRRGYELAANAEADYLPQEHGDFEAKDALAQHYIAFDELNASGGAFDEPAAANLVDSRIRAQFEGTQDTGLDPHFVSATRIEGSINVPSAEFVSGEGILKPITQIKNEMLSKVEPEKPIYTYCNVGMQSSLGSVLLEEAFPNSKIRMYNGSLKELEQRAPKRINAGPLHLVAQ